MRKFLLLVASGSLFGQTVYLRDSAPAMVQVVSATTGTPVQLTTFTPHLLNSTCGTTSVCPIVASIGVATNGSCPVYSVSVGSAILVNFEGGYYRAKYVDATNIQLLDMSNNPVAGHGTTSCSGESYYFLAGNKFIGLADGYTLGSSPLGMLDGPNGDFTRSLACGNANGCTGVVVSGCSGGAGCVATISTSFDSRNMKNPVKVGDSLTFRATGANLNTCGSGGVDYGAYTVASVNATTIVTNSFSCAGLSNGAVVKNSCGPAAVPNDTIGGTLPCPTVSFLAINGNPRWDAVKSTATVAGLFTGSNWKFSYDGGTQQAFSPGNVGPVLAMEISAYLFMLNPDTQGYLDQQVYYTDKVERLGGVNWFADEGYNAPNAELNGTNPNQFYVVNYLNWVKPWRSVASMNVFRDKILNSTANISGCTTNHNVIESPSPTGPVPNTSHVMVLASSTAQAGSSNTITFNASDSQPNGYYVGDVVWFQSQFCVVTNYVSHVATCSVSWPTTVPTGGSNYQVFAGASISSSTSGATATVTGVHSTFLSSYTMGDAIQISAPFSTSVGSNQSMVTSIASDTSMTVKNNIGVAGTGVGVAWILPQWQIGDCSFTWVDEHDFGYAGMAPALMLPGGGTTSGAINGSGPPNQMPNNPVYPFNHATADYDLCVSDDRACKDLSVSHGWLYDYDISGYMGYGLGGLRSGAQYSWGTTGSLMTQTLFSLYNSIPTFPSLDLNGGWLKGTVAYKLFNWYPDKQDIGSGQTLYAGLFAQTGGFSPYSFQNFATQGITQDPCQLTNPNGTDCSYLNYFLTNANPSIVMNGGSGILTYQPVSLLTLDPRQGSTNFNVLPHQVLLANNSATARTTLTGWVGQPAMRGDMVISRTGWGSRSDTYMLFQGRTWVTNDHDVPSNGEISICKVGCLIATDNVPADGNQTTNPITGMMTEFGGAANAPLGYPATAGYTTSTGVSPFVRWHSDGAFDPMYGSQASQYAWVCFNLNGVYDGVSPTQNEQCEFDSKVSGGDQFLIDSRVINVPSATSIDVHWHYAQNGQAPPANSYQEGNTTCGSGAVTSLEDGGGISPTDLNPPRQFGVISKFVSLGNTTVTCDGSSYSGGNGDTYRVTVSAGSPGSSQSQMVLFSVHKIAQNLTDTSLTTSALNPDANWSGVQAVGTTSGVVMLKALHPTLNTITSFTTTHSGTAQYLFGGLTPGIYAVTVNSVAVSGSPFNVVANDNSLAFNSTSGTVGVNLINGPSSIISGKSVVFGKTIGK